MKLNINQNFANRGMQLETDINITNQYYLEHNIAIIYKKPTPIKVLKTSFDKNRIVEAVFDKKSTLDYNGIWEGKYIEFDVKETLSKTSFPLSNIQNHQLQHAKMVLEHKGICFLIIRFVLLDKTYILLVEDLLAFIRNNSRKSIPLEYFEKWGRLIPLSYIPRLDYIRVLKKMII